MILNLIAVSFIRKKTVFYFNSDIIKSTKLKGTTTIKDLSTKIFKRLNFYSTTCDREYLQTTNDLSRHNEKDEE